MPRTDFEMKGNLNQKDLKFIPLWNNKNLFSKLESRKKTFILHDGPPYANGNIHVGHAFNKILKDFIARDEILKGKNVKWKFGWDAHGLPIELEVQKKGFKINDTKNSEYLNACKNYALEQIEKQEKQFKSLALLSNGDKYVTTDPKFVSKEIEVFYEMLNKGLIYQDLKPVYWSWSSNTALAESEIEYKEVEDPSVFIKFEIENSEHNFLIWTTTPWTIPANVALALGKKIKYSLVKIDSKQFIVADELIANLKNQTNKEIEFIKEIDISNLINKFAINPLNNNKSKIVYGHHVTTEAGTGVVHIAGGHGEDDYKIVKENKLDLIVVL